MSKFFILNADGTYRPTDSVLEWAEFFEHGDRIIEQTQAQEAVRVSTVFIGIGGAISC